MVLFRSRPALKQTEDDAYKERWGTHTPRMAVLRYYITKMFLVAYALALIILYLVVSVKLAYWLGAQPDYKGALDWGSPGIWAVACIVALVLVGGVMYAVYCFAAVIRSTARRKRG